MYVSLVRRANRCNPLRADDRNFYKVEKWTKDGMKVERMLYAVDNLGEGARCVCECHQAPPARQANDLTANAGALSVARGITFALGASGEKIDILINFLGR